MFDRVLCRDVHYNFADIACFGIDDLKCGLKVSQLQFDIDMKVTF